MPPRHPYPSAIAITFWCVGIGACVAAAWESPERNLRHPAVTGSAAITVAWMLAAWFAMLLRASRFARLAWSLGWLMLLVHFALAFGLAHGWSHAAAVEHVREVGGYGEGITLNYLFAAVWFLDVAWWRANPAGHAKRSPWIAWAIHGFLLFVVVNATVVFGPPERRWTYAAALGLLAGAGIARRSRR
jgi:hypothetical protein